MPDSLPTDEDLATAREDLEGKREKLRALKAEETENLYGNQRLIEADALITESKSLDAQIAEMQERVDASKKPADPNAAAKAFDAQLKEQAGSVEAEKNPPENPPLVPPAGNGGNKADTEKKGS